MSLPLPVGRGSPVEPSSDSKSAWATPDEEDCPLMAEIFGRGSFLDGLFPIFWNQVDFWKKGDVGMGFSVQEKLKVKITFDVVLK